MDTKLCYMQIMPTRISQNELFFIAIHVFNCLPTCGHINKKRNTKHKSSAIVQSPTLFAMTFSHISTIHCDVQ